MSAEGARAGDATEQAMQVACDSMKPRSLSKFPLDVRDQRHRGILGRGEAGRFIEEKRIDRKEPPWLLIGGAAHHDAVHVREVRMRFLHAYDPTVEHDRKARTRGLEPVDARIIERRNFAVLLGR